MSLIIMGHQRSGTSLLTALCASHPDVVLTNEFGNFLNLDQPKNIYIRYILKRWRMKRNYPLFPYRESAWGEIKGLPFLRNLAFVTRYSWIVHRKSGDDVTADTLEDALLTLFPGAKVVGDKYPDYWFQMDKLVRFESIKCLLIIRDPRDMAYSVIQKARGPWKDSWPEGLQDVRNVAKRWTRLIDAMKRNEGSLFTIRYEDLIADPTSIFNKLGAWLDLDPDGFPQDMIRTDRSGKYKTGLTAEEIASINDIVEPALAEAGYEL